MRFCSLCADHFTIQVPLRELENSNCTTTDIVSYIRYQRCRPAEALSFNPDGVGGEVADRRVGECQKAAYVLLRLPGDFFVADE